MNPSPERVVGVLGAEPRIELAIWILARLMVLDDLSRFPDVSAIREVPREILVEQLRELREDGDGSTRVAPA